jgi:hypothetical protein
VNLRPQAAWVSLGFGRSSNAYFKEGFAGVAGAWYSSGPLVAGARFSSSATSGLLSSTDDPLEDIALLVGLRTSARRAFLLGAVGFANVDRPAGSGGGSSAAVAYSLQASANYRYVGLAAEVFGAQGSDRASYQGIALSAQLGWFGR